MRFIWNINRPPIGDPFAYSDYNTTYSNQNVISTAYSTCNYFAMNTWQNSKINLDLYIHGEIRT